MRASGSAPSGVVILDGGLASELERRGADLSGALWSARLVIDDPELIVAAHLDYLRAGSRVITTASYQASIEGLIQAGLSRKAAERTLRRCTGLALLAVKRYRSASNKRNSRNDADAGVVAEGHATHDADGSIGRNRETTSAPAGSGRSALARRRPLVAASVGPYGAVLADGSEYTGDYGLSAAALADFHARRLEVMVESGPDLLALETIPSLAEVEALAALLNRADGPPAWLSVTCGDERCLADGTPIETAAAIASSTPRVIAFGVNCCHPRLVAPLLARAAGSTDLPLVAYPNRGEEWDPTDRTWRFGGGWSRSALASSAREWYSAGARWIGGCCRTTPEDIAAIAKVLADADDVDRGATGAATGDGYS